MAVRVVDRVRPFQGDEQFRQIRWMYPYHRIRSTARESNYEQKKKNKNDDRETGGYEKCFAESFRWPQPHHNGSEFEMVIDSGKHKIPAFKQPIIEICGVGTCFACSTCVSCVSMCVDERKALSNQAIKKRDDSSYCAPLYINNKVLL